jgi:uncharacterized membrane protein YesL
MKRILNVFWFAARGLYDEMFPLAGMGLLWFAMVVLPLYGVIWLVTALTPPLAVAIILLLIALIPAPPATAAMYHVAHYVAHERRIEFSYFWQGLKSYFGLSWKVGAILLVSGAILAIDVRFYLSSSNAIFAAVGFLGLWALLFWLAIQVYVFPLMVLQKDKSLKLILKNAALLTLAYPLFALGILIAAALATALSGVLVILLPTIWLPFVALLYSRATFSSLRQVEAFQQAKLELEEEPLEDKE